jgi:hypothetical protein
VSNELNYQAIESTDPRAGTVLSQGAGEGTDAVVGEGARADAGAEVRAVTEVSQGAGEEQ